MISQRGLRHGLRQGSGNKNDYRKNTKYKKKRKDSNEIEEKLEVAGGKPN